MDFVFANSAEADETLPNASSLFAMSVVFPVVKGIKIHLSYDVASGSEITPYNNIDKPLVVYKFMGNVMTSITTLRT